MECVCLVPKLTLGRGTEGAVGAEVVGRQTLTRVEGNRSKALADDFIPATTEERSDGEISVNEEKM